MNKSSKSPLKGIIIIGITLFLIPTFADMFSRNSSQKNSILSRLTNVGGTIQLIAVFLAVLSGVVYLLIIYKEKIALTVLEQAAEKDPVWDEISLKYQTRSLPL